MADCYENALAAPEGSALPDFLYPSQPAYGGQNGRVNFAQSISAGGSLPSSFTGFDYQKKAEPEFVDDMTRGNWEKNTLSVAFFSSENIDIIQNAIRSEVYIRSGEKRWVIDPQSVDELKIIMRAQYYTYGKNQGANIGGQIAELNKLVIDWVVPRVMSEVQHHFFYLKDISTMPVPMSHPVSMSSAGTKTSPNGSYMEKPDKFPF